MKEKNGCTPAPKTRAARSDGSAAASVAESALENTLGSASPACRLFACFGTRWALLTLLTLAERGTLRFGELRRALPGGVSERMLAATLDDLEAAGLVLRVAHAEVPPRVEYRTSPACATLVPILRQLFDWAREHAR